MRSSFSRLWPLSLALLGVVGPAGAAERSSLLLYGFGASAPATPAPIPDILAQLVRDDLEKGGRYTVSIRSADSPLFRRAESEQPGGDPTQLHQALRVARSLGARYVVQGVITAYEPPEAKAPGKITLRLTAASAETEVSRDVFVTAEMNVPGHAASASAKVMGPAARAVATAIVAEAIPSLDHPSPADRAQAAERARARGTEAAAGGSAGQAVDELRRAARLTPEDAATHVALGDALVKQGRLASALLELRQALDLEAGAATGPEGARALRLRVIGALNDQGLWDEAAAEARRGLEREPDSEPLRLALAEAEIRSGDGAAALAALRPLHAHREPNAGEWKLLAEGYALTGDAPRWLDAVVRGAVLGVAESGQYPAVIRRLDLAFHAQASEAAEAERRTLAGQMSLTTFRATAARRAAQAQVTADYLARLAFPEAAADAHQARQTAWSALARAAGQAVRFTDTGSYDDLAAARATRLQALGQLDQAPLK
jgi:Flp pilus assembly protein TadD